MSSGATGSRDCAHCFSDSGIDAGYKPMHGQQGAYPREAHAQPTRALLARYLVATKVQLVDIHRVGAGRGSSASTGLRG
jgi:hypothetical protein